MSTPPITTTALGAGIAGAGTTAAGVGTQATVAASPNPSAGSRYLNPLTRDYEIDPTSGQQAQMPATRQRVLLALMTLQGSASASPQFGIKAPRKIGNSYQMEMRHAVAAALRHLTLEDAPVIIIERVDVSRFGAGGVLVTVSFTDIATGKSDSASVRNP